MAPATTTPSYPKVAWFSENNAAYLADLYGNDHLQTEEVDKDGKTPFWFVHEQTADDILELKDRKADLEDDDVNKVCKEIRDDFGSDTQVEVDQKSGVICFNGRQAQAWFQRNRNTDRGRNQQHALAALKARRAGMNPWIAAVAALLLGVGIGFVQWSPWGRTADNAARVAEAREAVRNLVTEDRLEAALDERPAGVSRQELDEALASIQHSEGGTPARAEPDPTVPAQGAVSSAMRDRAGVSWVQAQDGNFVGVPADVDLQVGMTLNPRWDRRSFDELQAHFTTDDS